MICDDPNPDKIIMEKEINNPGNIEEGGGGGQNANKGNRKGPDTVSFHHCTSNQQTFYILQFR